MRNIVTIRFLVRVALCLAAFATLPARADVRLAKIFADHVVLQRDLPVNVWGWADPGESVTVKFDGQSVATVADAQGRWTAKLAPMKLNAVPQDVAVRYAFSMNPEGCNLYNQSGLPASPFRTDDW